MIAYIGSIILFGIVIGVIILGFETSLEWILDKAFDNNPYLVVGLINFVLICMILFKLKHAFELYTKSESNKKQIHDNIKTILSVILTGIIIGLIISVVFFLIKV